MISIRDESAKSPQIVQVWNLTQAKPNLARKMAVKLENRSKKGKRNPSRKTQTLHPNL